MKKFLKPLALFIIAIIVCLSMVACNDNTSSTGKNESNSMCVHEWFAATCTSPKTCALCGEEIGSALGHTTTNGVCSRCHEYIGENVTASYIAHRYMQYDETNNRFRFSFALQDENGNDIAINATVEMRIENLYGTVVYTGTEYVYEDDYREWYNAFNRWLGTAVYIPINEIDSGSINIGTLYYKVIVPDGTYFQYSIEIDEGLPVDEITLGINDVWNIPNNWNFTIEKVETHYACNDYECEYTNNDLSQYIIITYSYENTGYDIYDLAFDFTEFDVYDTNGEIGEYYMCTEHTKDCEFIGVNTKLTGAQIVFGLYNPSSTVRIDVSHYSEFGDLKATYIINVNEHIHNYDSGKCTDCGAADPNYKTPDIILGEYVTQNGTLQSNGKYMISWSPNDTTVTQIYWDPSEKTLLFAEQQTSTIGITTAGILYEYGVNKQRITVINDQTSLGNKITGIGYIYSNSYTPSNDDIYSYTCDATGSLVTANKSLAEACIKILVTHIDDFLDAKTDFDIKDFGFTQWPY